MKQLFTCLITIVILCHFTAVNSYNTIENHNIVGYSVNKREKRNTELKDFFGGDDLICKSIAEKYENLIETVENYVQRYVSLFLKISNLQNHSIKDNSEFVHTDLVVSLTGEELAFLQKLSKSTSSSKFINNLSKLNSILSNMAKLKEKSLFEDSINSSKTFLFKILHLLDFDIFTPYFIIILIGSGCFYFLKHKSVYLYIGIIVSSMTFWESLTSCKKKVKLFETEKFFTYVNKAVPVECDPANQRWYYDISTYIFGDKCLEYTKGINKEASEEVSFLQCIVETYSHYFIRIPVKLLGACMGDLTSEISASLPIFLKQVFQAAMSFYLLGVILVFSIILLGKRLKFSFFGSSVELGGSQHSTNTQKTAITNEQEKKKTLVRKKLRPWTKSRFPKRLELEYKRGKMNFNNVYKYDTE